MTISYWEDMDSMRAFSGDDPAKVHHLERDGEFLIELPQSVQIFRLRKSHGVTDNRRETEDHRETPGEGLPFI